MFLHILNYSVRGLIILLGILLMSGALYPNAPDAAFMRVMGAIFILFGIYRIVLYRTKTKKYNFDDWKEDEDFENENKEK